MHDLFNAAMMFVGESPWHHLGTKFARNATWEQIKATLPFYKAVERSLFMPGCPTPIPDRKALIADNDGRYLATVGKGYGIVQFEDMARVVTEAVGDKAVFHTAGLLGKNGATGWILGEIPKPLRIRKDSSPLRQFFLATGSHDGTSAVHFRNVLTRVVCRNTLGMAMGEDGASLSIRHTAHAAIELDAAQDAFAKLIQGNEKLVEIANVLTETQVSESDRKLILAETFPMPESATPGSLGFDRTMAKRADASKRADNGIGIGPEIRGSAWALFQGITEYADHGRTAGKGLSIEEVFGDQTMGVGADIKAAGFAAIRSVTGV